MHITTVASGLFRGSLALTLVASLAFASGCAADTSQGELGGGETVAAGEDALTGGPLADGTCDKDGLGVCLSYGGGEACYAKFGCKAGDEKTPGKGSEQAADRTNGVEFSNYYLNNYSSVDRERRKFWNQPFGCAATASTALKLGGFKVKQVLLTNEVETQLIKLGWTKITNMKALRAGDVVFASKSGSNVAGTYAHVYVFHNYTNSAKTYAKISDNNGGNISRNIGPGPKTIAEVAFRAPE